MSRYNLNFFAWTALAILIMVSVYAIAGANSEKHTVVFDNDSFQPSSLVVKEGDIVTFRNDTDKEFWPASDLHPNHTIYPEFDPREPIMPGGSWSFRLQKIGTWQFHDHLAPLATGTIKVIGRKAEQLAGDANDKCGSRSNKTSCWAHLLLEVVREQGMKAAFDAYAYLYDEEPDFAENCHDITHKIGEAAYDLYTQDPKLLEITSAVGYCSYGFFHGFMEAMLFKDGTLANARDFCDYIDSQLKGQSAAGGACMHGIGHGVTDGSDPRTWGDAEALISLGKGLCEALGRDDYEKEICGTGVFNSLEIMYRDDKYKLELDWQDPFLVCRDQEKAYFKHACYKNFKVLIMHVADYDFARAAKFIEGIKEDDYAQGAIDNLASYNSYFILREPSFDYAIDICHGLQPRLHANCIAGLGAGFMSAGVPDQEYIKSIELCESPKITKDERAGCFKRILNFASVRYSRETFDNICGLVKKEDRISRCKS